jgi:hypothetical protein
MLPIGLFPMVSAAPPGDSFDNALLITVGSYSNTLYTGEHFYKIEARKGQTLTLQMTVPDGSDHNLFLYDPYRNLLDSSKQSGSLDEEIRITVEVTGTYFVKVTGTRFSGSGTYLLTAFLTDFKIINAEWGTAANRPEASPGDIGIPIQLTVRNGGDYTAEDLVATLSLPPSFTNSTGGQTIKASIATTIVPGQTALFQFIVNIAENASIGSHDLTLILDYKIRTATELLDGSPEHLTAPIFLLGKVRLSTFTETQRLTPGETNNVTVTFSNTGTAASTAVEAIVTTPPTLTLLGAENRLYFEKISAGGTVGTSIPLQVSPAAAGSLVQITLSITYTDAYGTSRSISRSLGFEVVSEHILFQVTDVSWGPVGRRLEVGPGDAGVTLDISVQNLGENPVAGMRGILYLKPPFSGPLEAGSVSSAFGGTIQPGQFGSFEFIIDVDDDAPIGSYPLDLELYYLLLQEGQPQGAKPINLTVPVMLLGKADLAVSVGAVAVEPGETNPLALSITNLGSGEVSAVDISITYPSTVALSGVDNHLFAQIIKAGESLRHDISLFVPLQAAGSTIHLSFSISYRDPYGESRSVVRDIALSVSEIEGAKISVVDAVWGTPVSPIKVNLGDLNVQATLVVENTGTEPITGLSAEIRLPLPLKNSTGGNIVTAYLGGLVQPGGVAQLPFKVDLDEQGPTGLAHLSVSVNYLVVRGALYQAVNQDDLLVSLLLRERTAVEISVDGSVLTAETITDTTVTVANTGSDRIEQITLTITPPNTLSLTSGTSQIELRGILPGESRDVHLSLYAPASAVGLPLEGQLSWTFKDSYGLLQSGSKVFGLIVQAWSSPITVSTDDNILRVGIVSDPEIEIRNVGGDTIYSIQVALDLPSTAGPSPLILISGSNLWFFDSVSAGDSVSFNPMIIAAFSSIDSSYQSQLSISYRDGYGVSHSETRSIGFTARGMAVMTLLSQSSSEGPAGSNVQITGNVLNKGTASAYYTTLSVKPTSEVSPAVGGTVYLGEISTNTPFPFSISVTVSKDAANGTYPITLVFGYEDEYGSQFTFEQESQVIVGGSITPPEHPSEQGGTAGGLFGLVETYGFYLAGAAVLLILLLLFVRRRRSRDRINRRIAAAGGAE